MTTAQETFQKHLDYLSSGQIDKWMDLWNENGTLEFPFKLPVYPGQVTGKQAIREYIKHFPDYLEITFSKPVRSLKRPTVRLIYTKISGIL